MTSWAGTRHKILQVCARKVGGLKRSDKVGASFCRGSADNMILNTTLDVWSEITRGGSNLRG